MSISTTGSSSIVAPCRMFGREVEDVAGRDDPLGAVHVEAHAASFDDRHLLVRMRVDRRDRVRRHLEAAHHQALAGDHLPPDPVR